MFVVDRTLLPLEAGRLITRMEDKVKRSLAVACENLRRQFLEKTAQQPLDTELVFFYNLGSLLQYHYGEFDRAELLCEHIIEVCQTLAFHGIPSLWLGASVQPYINSARVAAARGQAGRSLEILKRVKLFVEQEKDLEIGHHRLSTAFVPELERGEENMVLVGRNVYLTDSLRALLIAEEYKGLLDFLAAVERDPFYTQNPQNRGTFLEGKARAHLGLAQYGEALGDLREFAQLMRSDSSRIYPAIYTLSAEVYWRCDQPAEAKKVLAFAEKLIERYLATPNVRRTAVIASHAYLIGLAYFRMRDFAGAARNGRLVLDLATEAGDEVLTMKALMLLLQTGGGSEEQISRWRARLAEAAAGTHYRLEKALSYLCLASLTGGASSSAERETLLSRSLALLGTIATAYAQNCRQELLGFLPRPSGARSQGTMVPSDWTSPAVDECYTVLINYVPDLKVTMMTSCGNAAPVTAAGC
jgi:hypothetical protein